MAPWGLSELLLRQIDFKLAGANWQRSGGKGEKPKPIDLPDGKGRGSKPTGGKKTPEEIAQALRAIGMIPAGTSE
jgi:hypothetical protein